MDLQDFGSKQFWWNIPRFYNQNRSVVGQPGPKQKKKQNFSENFNISLEKLKLHVHNSKISSESTFSAISIKISTETSKQ